MAVEIKASAGKDDHKASGKDTAADNAGLNLLSAHEGTQASGVQPNIRVALNAPPNHASDGGLLITPIQEFKGQPATHGAGSEKAEKQVAQIQRPSDRSPAGPVLTPGARDAWAHTGDGLPQEVGSADDSRAEYWGHVVDYVNSNARNPLDVTTKAIHDSRVVGFGESHDVVDNGFVKFGADNMAAFKAAGMTHLAVEVPSNLQPVLDNFQRTGVLSIPDHLMKDGKADMSDAALGALKLFKSRTEYDPGYVALLKAAQANGVKLVAVDKPDADAGFAHVESMTQQQFIQETMKAANPQVLADRNKYMADSIERVLDGKLSPLPKGSAPAKVGFWVGQAHAADTQGRTTVTTAGQILREHLSAKGEHYTSLYGQADTQRGVPSTMFALTPFVHRPAAIATHEAAGQPNVVGRLNEAVMPTPIIRDLKLSDFDEALLFPKTSGQ